MLLRLAAATVFGALIGLERERVESAAGLRTHAVVALGSAMFMLVSMFGFSSAGGPPGVVLDPSRVAAQIVSGIGFLGAGVIIFRKEIVRGLTTAASIWLVASIGMGVAGGLYLPAIGTTVLALAILTVMKPLERHLAAARRRPLVTVVIDRRRTSLTAVKSLLTGLGFVVERLEARTSDDKTKARLDVVMGPVSNERLLGLLEELPNHDGIREVRSIVSSAGASAPRAAQAKRSGERTRFDVVTDDAVRTEKSS